MRQPWAYFGLEVHCLVDKRSDAEGWLKSISGPDIGRRLIRIRWYCVKFLPKGKFV